MRTINYDEHVERIVEKIKEKSMRLRSTGKSRLDMPLRSGKMRDPQLEEGAGQWRNRKIGSAEISHEMGSMIADIPQRT